MEAQQELDQARIARAFKAFQDAARNRDADPETFEAARTRYYFLTKGPAWLEQEKRRIASEKLDPVIAEYRDMYTSLENEEAVQKGYTDSIAAIRDKQDDIKAGASKQLTFLERLLNDQTAKKSAFDRYVELTSPTSVPSQDTSTTEDVPILVKYFSGFPSSFSIILDVILAIVILFILFLSMRKTRIALSSFGSWFSRTPAVGGPSILIQTPAFSPVMPGRSAVINPR